MAIEVFSEKRKKNVHPSLIEKILCVTEAMKVLGFEMMITDGARTAEEQNKLYQKGRTKPGDIVTYADGYIKRSNHQLHSDGFGHAVDCTFVVNGKPNWDNTNPWEAYGECCKAVGLKWGGDNPNFKDNPHVELV